MRMYIHIYIYYMYVYIHPWFDTLLGCQRLIKNWYVYIYTCDAYIYTRISKYVHVTCDSNISAQFLHV